MEEVKQIMDTKDKIKVKERIGQQVRANNGQMMTFIKYYNYANIDIQFEDGTIVSNVRYDNFIYGKVNNPSMDTNIIRLGEVRKSRNGQMMVIIRYGGCHDIDVQFEDGYIAKNKEYAAFKKGSIANPKYLPRIGEISYTKSGEKITIIAYRNSGDIDVEFEDGFVAKHRRYENFLSGAIEKRECSRRKVTHLGEKNRASNGQMMTITNYNSYEDLEVTFEDGTVVHCDNYKYFQKGWITNHNFTYVEQRVGEINYANNGQLMKIIFYKNSTDIDVEFEDGYVAKHVSYGCFKKGKVKNPNACITGTSVGECALLHYLKPLGFQKYESGTLAYKGLRKYEFDCYNIDLKIAFEYDGPTHIRRVDSDSEKDALAFENALVRTIIRFRDKSLPPLVTEAVCYTVNTRGLSKDYEKCLREAVINLGFTLDIDFERDKNNIYNLYRGNIVTHKGEKQYSTYGQLMTITNYRNNQDIDIIFEDGTSRCGVDYRSFKKGTIYNPNYTRKDYMASKRIGEQKIANNGQVMKIIGYRGCNDMDVQFDDGKIKEHVRYSHFLNGSIANN